MFDLCVNHLGTFTPIPGADPYDTGSSKLKELWMATKNDSFCACVSAQVSWHFLKDLGKNITIRWTKLFLFPGRKIVRQLPCTFLFCFVSSITCVNLTIDVWELPSRPLCWLRDDRLNQFTLRIDGWRYCNRKLFPTANNSKEEKKFR